MLAFLENVLPSLGPFAPPTAAWGTLIAMLQCLMILTAGVNEVQNPTQYSKFADLSGRHQIPSRMGMLLLYAPSAVVATTMSFLQSSATQESLLWVSSLVALHFIKRVLESLFLHKYSGTMDFGTSVMIGTYYSLVSVLIIFTATTTHLNLTFQYLGSIVFLVGELGNLYHHYLLRQLRSNDNKSTKKNDDTPKHKRYVAPQGGLFRFVAAPHYLLEITAFVGIALVAQSLHALLVALSMGSYLTGRAVLTQRFYQQTFDMKEWSHDKKAIVPFLF